MVTKEFKSQFKDEDIDKVFGADSEYDFLKRVCTVYYMYLTWDSTFGKQKCWCFEKMYY